MLHSSSNRRYCRLGWCDSTFPWGSCRKILRRLSRKHQWFDCCVRNRHSQNSRTCDLSLRRENNSAHNHKAEDSKNIFRLKPEATCLKEVNRIYRISWIRTANRMSKAHCLICSECNIVLRGRGWPLINSGEDSINLFSIDNYLFLFLR